VIGLDTNILLRWLILPAQGGLASSNAEIERVSQIVNAEGASLFVNVVVMAEMAWILEQKLNLDRVDVSGVIGHLLFAENITLGNDTEIRTALMHYTSSNVGFADCLIGEMNLAAGCAHTLTFDKKASRMAGFRHVDDR
jgi:predicted nucleic-acid-binding protein